MLERPKRGTAGLIPRKAALGLFFFQCFIVLVTGYSRPCCALSNKICKGILLKQGALMVMRSFLCLVFACVSFLGMREASAQSMEPVSSEQKSIQRMDGRSVGEGANFGETINPQSGALTFRIVDIKLSGQGPDIEVSRSYGLNGKEPPMSHKLPFADWELEIPKIRTNLHAENVPWLTGAANPQARCSSYGPSQTITDVPGNSYVSEKWWRGAFLDIPGQASEIIMARGPAAAPAVQVSQSGVSGGFPLVTNSGWILGCLSNVLNAAQGEGFFAISPSGTKYWFNWFNSRLRGGLPGFFVAPVIPSVDAYLYVTRIEDRFGNYVTYSYAGDRISEIAASDGRKVLFQWSGNQSANATLPVYHIQSIVTHPGTADARTWNYGYHTAYDVDNYIINGSSTGRYIVKNLQTVTLPDGTYWSMDFRSFINDYYTYWENSQPQFGPCGPDKTLYACGMNEVSLKAPTGASASFYVERPLGHPGRSSYYPLEGPSYTPPIVIPGLQWSANLAPRTYGGAAQIVKKIVSGPGLQTTTTRYWLEHPADAPSKFHQLDPNGVLTVLTIDNGYLSATEGRELRKDVYAAGTVAVPTPDIRNGPIPVPVGASLRTVTNEYVKVPGRIGVLPFRADQYPVGSPYYEWASEYRWPLKKRVIQQDGATFTLENTSFDTMGRETSVNRYSSLGYSAQDSHEYHDDSVIWVLSQLKKKTTSGVEVERTVFGPLGLPTATYAFGKLQATLTYDTTSSVASGQRGTLRSSTNGAGQQTIYSNWYRGSAQSTSHPDGRTESSQVNANGLLVWHVDESGAKTCFTYDGIGRQTAVYHPIESTTSACDASGASWLPSTQSFAYVTSAEYGIAAGHMRRVTTTGNHTVQTFFDGLGRPLLVREYDAASPSTTQRFTKTSFDERGRVTFESYSSASSTPGTGKRYQYDALDRLVSVAQDSELGSLVTGTQYLAGFRTRVTSPKGVVTENAFQAFEAPSYELASTVSSAVGEAEATVLTIIRDAFGKPLSLTKKNPSGSISATRAYTYNVAQELCRIVEPESGATLLGYDGASRLSWSAAGLPVSLGCSSDGTAPEVVARKVKRSYDPRGRLTSVVFPDERGNTIYGYTSTGQPATISVNNILNGVTVPVVTQYQYNRRGLLTRESMAQNLQPALNIDYQYSPSGFLTQTTYPSGRVVTHSPNALGQVTAASQFAGSASYHPNGQLKSFSYGNGAAHEVMLNARQLVSSITDCRASGACTGADRLVHLSIAYDAHANVVGVTDGVTGNRQGRTAQYDKLDRLLQVAGTSFGTANYAYNAVDNVTSLAVTAGSSPRTHVYAYDANNRLSNVMSGGATVAGFAYDPQGNIRQKNATQYDFDFGNRLRSITSVQSYAYDGLGRRVISVRPSQQAIISQYDVQGKLRYQQDLQRLVRSEYIYLADVLVAVIETPQSTGIQSISYQHSDHLRSVVSVTDASKSVLRTSEFEPYGWLVNRPRQDGVGYAGHFEDSTSGLTYMQQRYYDAQVGLFLSVDPVKPIENPMGSFHRYRYANSNPLTNTDLDGRDCVSSNGWAICTPVGAGAGLPSIPIRVPDGWPARISSSGGAVNWLRHHAYVYRDSIGTKSPDAVRRSIINDPTPNGNDKPASIGGTPNDATPSESKTVGNQVRGVVGNLRNNDVKSFVVVASDGSIWEVNVTQPTHVLAYGYVMRGVVGNQIVTYGEGNGPLQGFGPVSKIGINDVWIEQNKKNVEEAAEEIWREKQRER